MNIKSDEVIDAKGDSQGLDTTMPITETLSVAAPPSVAGDEQIVTVVDIHQNLPCEEDKPKVEKVCFFFKITPPFFFIIN